MPAYLLARMLVSRSWAVAVALLSIAIPAMGYATSIVPESLAYLWFTTAALLAVRLFAAPSVGRAIPAILLALGGIWVQVGVRGAAGDPRVRGGDRVGDRSGRTAGAGGAAPVSPEARSSSLRSCSTFSSCSA